MNPTPTTSTTTMQESTTTIPLAVELVRGNYLADVAQLPTSLLAGIEAGFRPAFATLRSLEDEARGLRVTNEAQTQLMGRAREIRLALKGARVAAEKKRKELKSDALLMGRAIDGANNLLLAGIEPLERHLQEQEEFAERAAAARRDAVRQERERLLAPFAAFLPPYPALEQMTVEDFERLLDSGKALAEAAAKRKQQEEIERIERGRQAFLEAQRKAADEAEAKRKAAEHAAEIERLRKVADDERKARQAAEAAEAKRLADEAAAKKRAEDAARQAAQAPDREKLLAFAGEIRNLVAPDASTAAGKEVTAQVANQVKALAEWIERKAATL